jgi:hypothetical protein
MTGKISAATALLAGLWAGSAQAALVVSMAATSDVSCSGGVCTATAADAVLNAHDLAKSLAHGDTTLVSGSSAQDIEFDTPVHWTSAHALTLDSYRSITVTQPVMSEGSGGITIKTNDGGTGGDLVFTGKGRVVFWNLASSLVINGASYALAGDIAALASDVAANPSGNFALANNYDASVHGAYGVAPIPYLNGKFDGLGNTISNFQILYTAHSSANLGLFGGLDAHGSLSHLRMTHALIRSKYPSWSGILLGTNAGGTVSGAFVQGALAGANLAVGGLIGIQMGGSVTSSSATAVIHVNAGDPTIGGLIGAVEGGTVLGSHAAATLSGPNAQYGDIGGLVGGISSNATITNCFATGAFFKANIIGGLVATMASGTAIATSYANATIGGALGDPAIAGGLVGFVFGGTIGNSYAGGQTTRGGGLIGQGGGAVTSSYAFTHVANGGGVIGTAYGTFGNTYWDLDTSGIGNPSQGAANSANYPGITGLTDAQLKSGLPAGFDSSVWGESAGINNGLPYLLALVP